MCQILDVSRSGYYDWDERPKSNREKENEKILKIAKKSYEDSRGMYGLDKLLEDVREEFPNCSRNRLYRIQKQNNLYSKRKRKFKATTDSNHNLPVAENILKQDFTTDSTNEVWVSDISYIDTDEGWLYLATVKDIFNKEIVGWTVSNNMKTDLCMRALDNAVRKHRPQEGLIHHSDRGVQYCSNDYQNYLRKHKMICSMSRKGDCYDNACAETFFSAIKCEMLYHKKYKTREEARRDIFWYIEIFYNRKRRHQTLGYKTPVQFKQMHFEGLAA